MMLNISGHVSYWLIYYTASSNPQLFLLAIFHSTFFPRGELTVFARANRPISVSLLGI